MQYVYIQINTLRYTENYFVDLFVYLPKFSTSRNQLFESSYHLKTSPLEYKCPEKEQFK